MPTISITMPAYNVEKYISAAIDSILAQTFKDWELIICDDCSSDNTVAIIEDYQKKDNRIKLIKRENNSGGCRLPRFDAILMANGNFVCPIDSDDTIEETYLEKLFYKQNSTNSDIVLSKMIICGEDLKPRDTSIPKSSYDISKRLSGREAVKETIGEWNISMNGLLAKTNMYKSLINTIYSSNHNGGFIDEIDHRKLLLCAKDITITDAKYFYRQQPNSIVHSTTARSYNNLIANRILLEFVFKLFSDEKDVIDKISDEYLEKIYRALQKFYLNSNKYTLSEKGEIRRTIKESYSAIKEYNLTFNNKRNKFLSGSYTLFNLCTWCLSLIIKFRF